MAPSWFCGVAVPPCCCVGKRNIMSLNKLNVNSFFAAYAAAGKTAKDDDVRIVTSHGTVQCRAINNDNSWFIVIKNDETGKRIEVGCTKNSDTVNTACTNWEVKELELMVEKTFGDKTYPKGHRSFKAYPVLADE